jgi:hypothetical protein
MRQEDASPNSSSNRCPGALKVTKLATAAATATDERMNQMRISVVLI